MVRLPRVPARLGCAVPNRLPAPPKLALPFYQSPEWRALRDQVISARGKQCERCSARGFVIADHKVEIRDGGARLDPSNIRLLCAKCHGRKTAQAKRARLGLSAAASS